MKCPIDQTELQRSERHGIEIDHCPKCRGIWLDRGELDKIIERNTGGAKERDGSQGADAADILGELFGGF